VSGRPLGLENRKVRISREVGKIAGVRKMGATSSDVGSAVSVYFGGVVCCVIQGMAVLMVITGREDGAAKNGGGKSDGSAPCVTRGNKAAGVGVRVWTEGRRCLVIQFNV
jgi:hypothetical protein